jgi:hypothetical protein
MPVLEINKNPLVGYNDFPQGQIKTVCPILSPEKNSVLINPDQFNPEKTPGDENTFQRPFFKKENTVVMARHIHTENHHNPVGKVTVKEIQNRYKDTDFVGIEDHGRFFAFPANIPDSVHPSVLPGAESYVQIDLIRPTETVNVKHHVGILGVDAAEQSKFKIKQGLKPSEIAENIHKADGVIIFNHPEFPYIDKAGSSEKALDYMISRTEAEPVDGVEVVNDVGFTGSNPLNVIKWVERNFYDRGLFPAIVAGQDDHGPTEISRNPTFTMAITGNNSEHSLMDSLRHSKTFISKARDTKMEINIDGVSGLGEKKLLKYGSAHVMNFELNKIPVNSRVEVVYNGNIIKSFQVNSDSLKESLCFSANKGKDGKTGYLYLRSIGPDDKLNFLSSALNFSVE